MPLRCTCGAALPEDARFCHKCGKPQLEEDIARLASQEPVAPAPASASVASTATRSRIGFGNVQALLITMAVAAFSLVVLCVTAVLAPPLGVVVLCGAGFLAAKFYDSNNPGTLTTGGGAFLGMMTGLWLFLVMALATAFFAHYVSTPDGRDLLLHVAALQKVPDMAKVLDNPQQFVSGLMQGLILMFFLSTISAALGGMLATRRSARGRRTS